MNKSLLTTFLCLVAMCATAQERICLNGTWEFSLFNDKNTPLYEKANIAVPGNWEMQGFGEPVYGEKTRNETAHYSRKFTVPKTWKKKNVFIAFEGVQAGYTLYINKDSVGTFASSFNKKDFDITRHLKYGKENEIEVKVITHPKGYEFDTNDDWSLHGIYRDVYLYALPKAYIEHVSIIADADYSLKTEYKVVGIKKYKILEEVLLPQKQWTAETPYMNILRSTLKDMKGHTLHQIETRFGYRTISTEGGIFTVNGKPVKLHGVNYHDLSHTHGRGLSKEEIDRDVRMMKEANVNFIRCAHYPPQQYLLELCDSLGIYVANEVPFGFGDKHLSDTTYLPILKERAFHTWVRDCNHPSIILWTIGNENPLTPICVTTGEYMHQLDPTRPYAFPQYSRAFNKMIDNPPADLPLWDYHYASPGTLRSIKDKLKGRPLFQGEFAHALGLDFGNLENAYEELYRTPQFMGGAVWMFQDQGIVKHKAPSPLPLGGVIDTLEGGSFNFYDTSDILGTDGIVYANRIPQTDYFDMKGVFCPVRLKGNTVTDGGIDIEFENRYDFLNLNTVKIRWTLMRNTKQIGDGNVIADALPHSIGKVHIPLPNVTPDAYHYLVLDYVADGIEIGKDVIQLTSLPLGGVGRGCSSLLGGNEGGLELSFFTRYGRKVSMTQDAIEKQKDQMKKHSLSHSADDWQLDLTTDTNGLVSYTLTPTTDTEALECGLSFLLPNEITEVRWVGMGPYPTYPNKHAGSKFGIYHLNTADLYLPGNRSGVDIALFTDKQGQGFAMLMDKGDFAIERTEAGIVVSHNLRVGGRFNKNVWPSGIPKLQKGESLSGSFTLIPITAANQPLLSDIFGNINEQAKPFTPFSHSYDE